MGKTFKMRLCRWSVSALCIKSAPTPRWLPIYRIELGQAEFRADCPTSREEGDSRMFVAVKALPWPLAHEREDHGDRVAVHPIFFIVLNCDRRHPDGWHYVSRHAV